MKTLTTPYFSQTQREADSLSNSTFDDISVIEDSSSSSGLTDTSVSNK